MALSKEKRMTERKKTVLITGGTDGLGRATTLLLARKGYVVFAAGRSSEKRQELDRLAHDKNLSIRTLEMDVTDNLSVEIGVEFVLEKGGRIDVLINNAGVGYLAVVEELRLEDLRKQFETNLFGVLRVTQAVLPHMRAERSGRILMMSSVAGLISPPTYGAYSSSKHALEGLTDSLRLKCTRSALRSFWWSPAISRRISNKPRRNWPSPMRNRLKPVPTPKSIPARGREPTGVAGAPKPRRKIARSSCCTPSNRRTRRRAIRSRRWQSGLPSQSGSCRIRCWTPFSGGDSELYAKASPANSKPGRTSCSRATAPISCARSREAGSRHNRRPPPGWQIRSHRRRRNRGSGCVRS